MLLNLSLLQKDLKEGAFEIADTVGIAHSDSAKPVVAEKSDLPSVSVTDEKVVICYNKKVEFFRMLSMVKDLKNGESYSETPRHTSLSYMADQSRNAVFNVPSAKRMVRYLAALGYTEFMLYTEDTYEIEGEDYFGYMRGRWTKQELRDLDAYALMFGIELVPCIQTLAHLERMFVWSHYAPINDKSSVMLVGEPETYKLIEKMFATCAECFTSRKINIGMDEALDLGLGKYLDRNGYRRRYDIITEHLEKVLEIAKKYGFSASIWSDMYFRLTFGGSYYSKTGSIPKDVIDAVPNDVTLVYWDYYATDVELFRNMLKCHKDFNNPVAFAGGVQKWGNFASCTKLTLDIESMHIDECIDFGITDIMTTGWGDNGAEASHFSIMPGLTLYAEKCYNGSSDIKSRFESLFGVELEAFNLMSDVNYPDKPVEEVRKHEHFARLLLYSDAMLGIFNKHIDRDRYTEFYEDIAEKLEKYTDNKDFGYIIDVIAKLAKVDAYKSALPIDMRKAYEKGDKEALATIVNVTIPKTVEAVGALTLAFEKMWLYESRPFGLETHQLRLGGLARRLEGIGSRISSYLCGDTDSLPELEQKILYADDRGEDYEGSLFPKGFGTWTKVSTPAIL